MMVSSPQQKNIDYIGENGDGAMQIQQKSSGGKQIAGFVGAMQTQNASRGENPTTSDNVELIRFLPQLDILWNWEAEDKVDGKPNNGIYFNQPRLTCSQENI